MATTTKQSLKPIANSNGTFTVGNQTFKDAQSAAKALARRSTAPVITKKAPVAAVNNNQPGADTQAGTTTPNIQTIPTVGTETPVMPTAPKPGEKTTVLPISKDSDVYKKLIAKGYDDTKIMELYDKARSDRAAYEKTQKADTTAPAEVAPATPAAPVNVNVNTAAPEPVAPVAQPNQGKTDANGNIIPLTPKALSEYQDNSTARQNEIVNNLNSYRQTNPEFMTSLDTFRKTFSYGLRSDDQKQLLDNWYLGYQKGIELGNMGTNAIVDQYGSGNITSSDLEQLRLNNPAKYQEAMDAINKKDIVRTYQNELYETDEQKTIMQQLDDVDGQGTIFEEYKKTINSDEVKALQSEIQDMETQREQLSLELNDIQDQVEKRYEGTGATKGKIAYIVAKESAALQKQITSLGIDSANRVDKYNSIVNTAKETMQLQLQEQEAERAARNQKMQELGFYYEYDPVGMAERAENIFNIENPDINSPDANTARRALNNELTKYYEKYGDIIIRPQSQALNDILAQAKADGTSLSAALKKNFTDQLQSKQLYGQTLGKSLGFDMGSYSMSQGSDGNWRVSSKNTSEIRNINGVDYSYDPATGQYSTPNTPVSRADVRSNLSSIVSSTGASDMSTIATAIQNNYQDGVYGGQCGEFINDISGAIGSSVHFGDTLSSKISQVNSTEAKVGSYVVMSSKTSPGSGHVGLVTAINNDGTIQVKSSNYRGDEKVRTDTISMNSSSIKGYVTTTADPSKINNGNISDFDYSRFNNTTFKPQDIKDEATKVAYKEYLAERQRIFNDPEATAEDILKVSLGGGDLSDTSLQKLDKFTGVLSSLGEISKSIKGVKSGPINGILSSNNPYNTKAQLLKAQLTSITPALARGVYGEVGVLTDADIKLYQQTIPNLKQTTDVQKAVLAMTLKTVQRGMENSLKTQARAGKDVSAFIGELKSIQSQVSSIEEELGMNITNTQSVPVNYGYINGGSNIGSDSWLSSLSSLVD